MAHQPNQSENKEIMKKVGERGGVRERSGRLEIVSSLDTYGCYLRRLYV